MYDIIGDIHGHAAELKQLLSQLDYQYINGVWQHPSRKVIFLGDYVDRGPAIKETLEIVYAMVENDKAIALMGNHEFNALAYAYSTGNGQYLRSHNEKNNHQHRATLDQFKDHPGEWKKYLDWFYTLPIFLETHEFRAVHACWDREHMDWLYQHYSQNNRVLLTEELLVKAHRKNSQEYNVIEDVLKGKEVDIPLQFAWEDKDGNFRNKNRIKWWIDPEGKLHGDLLFNCPEDLCGEPFPIELHFKIYGDNEPPVFFGHYWLTDQPTLMAKNIICLDYSVAKNGSLVAYRWNPGEEIHERNFHLIHCLDKKKQSL